MISGSLFAKNAVFSTNIFVETAYDNNILKLSSNDLVRFKNGYDPEKFSIKTSDDLITSAKVRLDLKHYKIAGHTQINRIALKYNKYWQNDFLDYLYLQFSLKQYLSKKFNFELDYYFYPRMFVNKYDSVLDDATHYRDFSYSKNSYIGKINYSYSYKFQINYKFEYSQLFYNKYFTEYDADNILNEIEIGVFPLDKLRIFTAYSYKISQANAANAFDDLQYVSQVKDASYKADMFALSADFPKLVVIYAKLLDLNLKGKYERYFYQTDDQLDIYHYGRYDKVITLSSKLGFDLKKNVSLDLFYQYRFRNTSSPFLQVETDKTYNVSETGLAIRYSL